MSTSLEDRGRALEDEFFHKENQKKIDALRGKLDAQRTRDELRRTSGMTDDAVLDRLIALGSDSGLAVRRHAVVVDADGARAIAVPRLYQALRATVLGLAAAFLGQVLEVPELRDEIEDLLGVTAAPQAVMRLGYAEPVTRLAPRRELDDVLVEE